MLGPLPWQLDSMQRETQSLNSGRRSPREAMAGEERRRRGRRRAARFMTVEACGLEWWCWQLVGGQMLGRRRWRWSQKTPAAGVTDSTAGRCGI